MLSAGDGFSAPDLCDAGTARSCVIRLPCFRVVGPLDSVALAIDLSGPEIGQVHSEILEHRVVVHRSLDRFGFFSARAESSH
jgi:hypothetical protein